LKYAANFINAYLMLTGVSLHSLYLAGSVPGSICAASIHNVPFVQIMNLTKGFHSSLPGLTMRSDLRTTGLHLAADLTKPQMWQVNRQGACETRFRNAPRNGERRFHIPFIVMTAGEFRMRHGGPATPRRIAEWLRMSLQAWRDSKRDGVVTYCLDKRPESQSYRLAQKFFREIRN
jgi:hypothetical protein